MTEFYVTVDLSGPQGLPDRLPYCAPVSGKNAQWEHSAIRTQLCILITALGRV
jgi:hypothetical protein